MRDTVGVPGENDATRAGRRLRACAVLVILVAASLGLGGAAGVARADGTFEGSVPASGVGLGVWSGGDVTEVGPAVAAAGCSLASVWTAVDGTLMPYIAGAPAVANAAFIEAFDGLEIPNGTALIIVCGSPSPAFVPLPQPTGQASPPATFGDGTYTVGEDIQPGRYRARQLGNLCYWERLSGFSGDPNEIIANDIPVGSAVVDILPGDAGFSSSGCGQWTADLSPITGSPSSPFGDGAYIVGVDIAPGTWSAPGGPTCYWERRSGFSGAFDELLANDLPQGSAIVTIAPADVGFSTHGCGEWSRN
jgi:hypothetical protein